MALPQSAADAGNNLHNNFLTTIRDLPSLVAQAVGSSLPGGRAIVNAPGIVEALAPPTMDFIHGLMTGHAAATAGGGEMQARVATSAPKAAAAKPAKSGDPNAGATITLGDGTKAVMPSAAFLAANPATPYAGGPVAGAISASSGGGSSGATTPLDIVRAAAMANGGLSLNQLGAMSEALGRLIPPVTQRVPTMRDQAIGLGLQIAQQKAAADMADAKKNNDPVAYRKATDDLFQNVRTLGASPNQMFDVDQVAGN